jgi:hypothetical protein
LSIIGGNTSLGDVSFSTTNVTIDSDVTENYLTYQSLCKNIHCEHSGNVTIAKTNNYKINESLWIDPGNCVLSGASLKDMCSAYATPVLESAELSFNGSIASVTFNGSYLIPSFALFRLYSWDPVEKVTVDVLELDEYISELLSINRYVAVLEGQWPTIITVFFFFLLLLF